MMAHDRCVLYRTACGLARVYERARDDAELERRMIFHPRICAVRQGADDVNPIGRWVGVPDTCSILLRAHGACSRARVPSTTTAR
jgi:hypothetical protein